MKPNTPKDSLHNSPIKGHKILGAGNFAEGWGKSLLGAEGMYIHGWPRWTPHTQGKERREEKCPGNGT